MTTSEASGQSPAGSLAPPPEGLYFLEQTKLEKAVRKPAHILVSNEGVFDKATTCHDLNLWLCLRFLHFGVYLVWPRAA